MNFLFVFGSFFPSFLPSLYTPKSFEQRLHLKSTFTTNLFQFLFLFWWIPVIYFPKQNKTHKVKHNNLHQTLQNQRKTNSKISNEKDLNPRAPSFGINNWVLSLSSSRSLQGKTQRRKPWLVPKRVWVLELFKLNLRPRESLKGIEQKELVMAWWDFLIYCLLFPFFSSKLWFLCFWFSCDCDDVGKWGKNLEKGAERETERNSEREIKKEREN